MGDERVTGASGAVLGEAQRQPQGQNRCSRPRCFRGSRAAAAIERGKSRWSRSSSLGGHFSGLAGIENPGKSICPAHRTLGKSRNGRATLQPLVHFGNGGSISSS
jgi:hypothetical protein